MKRSIVLGVIAVALLVLYTTTMSSAFLPLIIIMVFALFSAIVYNEFIRWRCGNEEAKPFVRTVDELTAQYGEPEDVILLNAARANEALGVILAYKDFLVVEGRRIDKSDITGVTFNNSGTPYAPGEYQVIIATLGEGFIHVNTGYDATWTKDVVEEIKKAFTKRSD